MGYFLVRESMFDSVIHARDRWLKPNGMMYALSLSLSLSPPPVNVGTEFHLMFWLFKLRETLNFFLFAATLNAVHFWSWILCCQCRHWILSCRFYLLIFIVAFISMTCLTIGIQVMHECGLHQCKPVWESTRCKSTTTQCLTGVTSYMRQAASMV